MNITLDIETFKIGVANAMEKGFLATFTSCVTDEAVESAKDIATRFSEAASPILAEAIETFIKSGAVTVDGSSVTQTFTVVGTSPAGAVTGVATGNIVQPYKMV